MKQDKLPLLNPHASAIKQDKQWLVQKRWLKAHSFKSIQEAIKAGF